MLAFADGVELGVHGKMSKQSSTAPLGTSCPGEITGRDGFVQGARF